MSIATMINPQQSTEDWVCLAECSRILGRHINAVKSVALTGAIRTRAIPGARILYSRLDAEQLARSLTDRTTDQVVN